MTDGRRYIGRQGTGTRTWSRCCWTRWRALQSPRRILTDKTALHWAAENGHKDVVALLLDKMEGASIAATDYDGKTALHWAAMNGHKDVVALLLDKMEGASIAATDDGGQDGVTLGGNERAQGRGRAAVGQDGGRFNRRDGL